MSEEGPVGPESSEEQPGLNVSRDERTMAMLAHILGIVTSFIGALIIWMIKKDESPFVNDQGKEALNFQLTVLIGWIAAGLLTQVMCIGTIIAPAVGVANLIFCILAGLKANEGEMYRYPINIRFIK